MITMNQLIKTLGKVGNPDVTKESIKAAKKTYSDFRVAEGFAAGSPWLLTPPGANLKMSKGDIMNYGLSLSPERVSGVANLCPYSTPGCRHLCINTSGNGNYPAVQSGRITKTKFLIDHSAAFLTLLKNEIGLVKEKAAKDGKDIAVRLNVFSDIVWEKAVPWIFEAHSDVQFYDYTKDYTRFENELPSNYHLTLSASERYSDNQVKKFIDSGINVAIVADKVDGEVPAKWYGRNVHDGDITDYRPKDPDNSIIFLKPKGRARNLANAPRGQFVRTDAGFETAKKVAVA